MRETDQFIAGRSALEALVAHLPDSAVFVIGADLRFTFAAGDGMRSLGFDPNEMLGGSLAQALGDELAAAYEPYVRDALAGTPFTFYDERDEREYVFRGAPLRGGPGPDAVLVLVHDITARRHVEHVRRALRDRQAFLYVLTERLRALDDPDEIQLVAARSLREHLGVSRAGYAEDEGNGEWLRVTRDDTDGSSSIVGRHHYPVDASGLLRRLREGATISRPDMARARDLSASEKDALARMDIRASVNVPLVKGGRLVAVLFAHHATPRDWAAPEIELMEAVADQTWAAVERARAELAVRLERTRAQLALDAAAMGSFVWLAEEDHTEADERMLALFGLTAGSPLTLARALDALIHEEDRERYAAAVALALAPDGDGTLHEDIRVCHPDGTERWLTVLGRTSFRGDPARGVAIAGAAFDVTDAKTAELARRATEAGERLEHERSGLLADVIAELDALDTVHARLERLIAVLVPRAADYGWVELVGTTRRLGQRGARLHSTVKTELAVPLSVRDQPFATIVLGFRPGRGLLLEQDFVHELTSRVEVSLASGTVREEEHSIALGLQRALLPARLAEHPSVEIAARYEAGSDALEVGGDWYDAFALADGRLGLCVGDVVGHGLEAAAAMGRMRVALATLAAHEPDPGLVLAELEEVAGGPNGIGFLTVAYAMLDPRTRRLSYASAGHPPMLVVSPAGTTRWLEDGASTPISEWHTGPRAHGETVLEPGDLLVLYSDGLVERRGESLDDGLERLRRAASALVGADLHAVCDGLLTALDVAERRGDDVVVLCVRPG